MSTPTTAKSAASFDEMRRILRELPGPDLEAQTRVVQRQTELTKPAGSLGRLEEIAEWLAAWQGRAQPRVERPRIAVFAGTHGVAARGVSAYPPEVTQQMVKNFLNGGQRSTSSPPRSTPICASTNSTSRIPPATSRRGRR